MGKSDKSLKVQVWIHSGGKVLVLRTGPNRGSFWQPVTGHVEPGETLLDAARREAEEETGFHFKATPEPLGYAFDYLGQWGPALEHAFSLEAPSKAAERGRVKLDSKEHVDSRWVMPEEALKLLKYDSNAEALRRLMRRLEKDPLEQESKKR